jgi:hypothetical protein
MTDPPDGPVAAELAGELALLRSGHEVASFMDRLVSVDAVRWRPLPADMAGLIASSPDYAEPAPGTGPHSLMISGGDGLVELVLYRARADGGLYVLAPA